MKPLPRITYSQRKGVKKLLEWSVSNYKNCNGVNAKRMWKQRIDFLAELQRKQSYNNFDRKAFNLIREEYYQHKLG